MANRIDKMRASSSGDWDNRSWSVLRDTVAVLGPECEVNFKVVMNGGRPVRIITDDVQELRGRLRST